MNILQTFFLGQLVAAILFYFLECDVFLIRSTISAPVKFLTFWIIFHEYVH